MSTARRLRDLIEASTDEVQLMRLEGALLSCADRIADVLEPEPKSGGRSDYYQKRLFAAIGALDRALAKELLK